MNDGNAASDCDSGSEVSSLNHPHKLARVERPNVDASTCSHDGNWFSLNAESISSVASSAQFRRSRDEDMHLIESKIPGGDTWNSARVRAAVFECMSAQCSRSMLVYASIYVATESLEWLDTPYMSLSSSVSTEACERDLYVLMPPMDSSMVAASLKRLKCKDDVVIVLPESMAHKALKGLLFRMAQVFAKVGIRRLIIPSGALGVVGLCRRQLTHSSVTPLKLISKDGFRVDRVLIDDAPFRAWYDGAIQAIHAAPIDCAFTMSDAALAKFLTSHSLKRYVFPEKFELHRIGFVVNDATDSLAPTIIEQVTRGLRCVEKRSGGIVVDKIVVLGSSEDSDMTSEVSSQDARVKFRRVARNLKKWSTVWSECLRYVHEEFSNSLYEDGVATIFLTQAQWDSHVMRSRNPVNRHHVGIATCTCNIKVIVDPNPELKPLPAPKPIRHRVEFIQVEPLIVTDSQRLVISSASMDSGNLGSSQEYVGSGDSVNAGDTTDAGDTTYAGDTVSAGDIVGAGVGDSPESQVEPSCPAENIS